MHSNKKSWRIAALSCAGIFLALATLSETEAGNPGTSDPETIRSEAHDHLLEADRARDAEDWAQAVFHYRSAQRMYQELLLEFPDWDPDYLEYRLEYCDEHLQAIWEETGRDEWYWWEQQRREWQDERMSFEARRNAIMEENRYLRERLRRSEDMLADVAEQIEEIESLREHIQRLEEENRELRRMLDRRPQTDAPVPRGNRPARR